MQTVAENTIKQWNIPTLWANIDTIKAKYGGFTYMYFFLYGQN